jgi:CheY-like chemotaxis protein/glycine cleavage system H lipoate-binding protein
MTMMRDILVVEDEQSVSQAVKMVCSKEGMSVTVVDNAQEALRRLSENSFRLVLCDIMMHELDGFQFLEALNQSGIHIPVVMMTGYSTVENAVKSLAAGAIDYMPKPFTADELLTVISRSLRSGELLDEAESAGLERESSMHFIPCPNHYLRLGYVSWALMEDEGTALIGVSDLFLKAVDGIQHLELMALGEDIMQGIPCAVATSPDGSAHGIMCPMGGKILEVNAESETNPSLVEKDPYFKGWLYRILPSDPESDMQWLSI